MNKKLLLIFTILLFSMTVSATDYFVAELSGETLTFKKTTTAPDEVTSWDATNTSTSYSGPGWYNSAYTAVVIDPSFAEARPISCYHWFWSYHYSYYQEKPITSITGLEYLNTSQVTNMSGMFDSCSALTSLDLSSFDTSNVTSMSGMFEHCSGLISLDLSGFDTSNVTDMAFMFLECSSLTRLDMSNFDTSKVTDMRSMFRNCNTLTLLDLSSFDCRNLTNVESMFADCTSLQTIFVTEDLGEFNNNAAVGSQWPFSNNGSLTGGAGEPFNSKILSSVAARIDRGGYGAAYFSAAITLADAVDNSTTISDYDTDKVKVTLTDRTLYKDGKWNTLCLPFNVTLAGSALEGATARTLTAASVSGETLYLTFGDAVATLEAGVPYIIKWDSGDDIVEPSFLPVFISSEANNFTSADGKVSFKGNYAPVAVSANNEHVLFMGGDNTLYYPTTNRSLRCQRAHFELADGVAARNYVIDFGEGEATTISGVLHQKDMTSTNAWFSIDGRRLANKPLTKGVYIHNGRKEVVK